MFARLRKHLPLAASLLLPGVAMAHSGHADAPALLAGLLHPFSGADHLLLMLGVGLWASRLVRRGLGLAAVLAATAAGCCGVRRAAACRLPSRSSPRR